MNDHAEAMLAEHPEPELSHEHNAQGGSHSHAPFRRRPIVVRDPKTGATRLVNSGPPQRRAPRRTPPPSRYRSGFEAEPYDRSHVDDDNLAPIMKVISGYRGRRIVVRDPSRRPLPQHVANTTQLSAPLGVRTGGVRKATYYDRRAPRSPPYSSDGYEDRGRRDDRDDYYDDDEEEEEEDDQFYARDRGSDYDRALDRASSAPYDARYQDRQYYRMDDAQHAVPEEEDLTGKVVYVDNLSSNVTTSDLADIFGMVGAVKELRLLYDRQGNPNGSADIVFQRRADAEEAIRSLHNVPLNTRPMRLTMGNGL